MPNKFDVEWEAATPKATKVEGFDVEWEDDAPVINEQHPEVERQKIMNLAPTSRAAAEYLRGKDFEVKERGGDFDFDIRKKGEKEYRKLDPEGFDVGDLGDIGADVVKGGLETAAGIAGLAGGPWTGIAAAGGTGLAAESARQVLGKLLGFNPNLLESAKEIGFEGALGAGGEIGGQLIGKAVKGLKTANPLRIPLAIEGKFTNAEGKAAIGAAERGVKTAAGNLARARNWWDDEAGRRLKGLGAVLGEGVDDIPAPPRMGAKLGEEEAARMGADAIGKSMGTKGEGSIRFLTHLIDPVWGVKAASLKYVPELRAIAQKHLGRHFRNEFGSEAMLTADQFVKKLATELPEGEAEKISIELAKDLGKWMKSGNRLKGLTAAEQEAAERMAAGAGSEADAATLGGAIRNTMGKPMEIQKTQQELLRARRSRDIAKAHAAAFQPAPSRWLDEQLSGQGGRYLKQLLGAGYLSTAGAATRGADALGRFAEWILSKSTPSQLKVAAKKAAPWAARSPIHVLGR
jgi:hypothetical protein